MKITHLKAFFAVLTGLFLTAAAVSQEHGHAHDQEHPVGTHAGEGACGITHEAPTKFDPGVVAFHHVSDQNIYSIGGLINIPLPTILYTKDRGWFACSSSRFHLHAHHGDGAIAVEGFVLIGGKVMRVNPALHPDFPTGEVEVSGFKTDKRMVNGKAKD